MAKPARARSLVVKLPKKAATPPAHPEAVSDDLDFFDDKLFDEFEQDLADLDPFLNKTDHKYKNDPKGWMNTRLGDFIWSKQVQIAESVRDHRYTAVKSCHQIGKSFIAAAIVCWWLDTHEDAFVVTTAPTGHQVRTILWRYIKRLAKKAGMKGRISEGQVPEWKIGNEIVGFGRKPADYVDPTEAATAFQGIHALHVLVVMDEASGIPKWLVDAIDTLVGNPKSRVLAVGNPDNPASEFAKMFGKNSDYHQITVPYSDTPAFTDEEVPEHLYDLLVSPTWVEERRKKWGENSPMFRSKVLAEFPKIADNTVFSPQAIETAVTTDRSRHAMIRGVGNAGFDVARFGTDENVVFLNRNGYARLVGEWGKTDTMESVGRFRRLWADKTAPTAVIDTSGVGGGVYDRLNELGYSVASFDGGSRAFDPTRFKNRRAEAYWEAAEACEEGRIDIEDIDEDLQAELLEVQYKINSTGQIVLEDKEEIKARLGRSPNRADAFVMCLQDRANWQKVLTEPEHQQNTGPTHPPPHPEPEEDFRTDDLIADLMEMQF